jgi:hypothetical protein
MDVRDEVNLLRPFLSKKSPIWYNLRRAIEVWGLSGMIPIDQAALRVRAGR